MDSSSSIFLRNLVVSLRALPTTRRFASSPYMEIIVSFQAQNIAKKEFEFTSLFGAASPCSRFS